MAKNKIITYTEYKALCKEFHEDIQSEGYEDEQIWDLAKCIIEGEDESSKKVIAYLKSIGVKDLIGRLANDIY